MIISQLHSLYPLQLLNKLGSINEYEAENLLKKGEPSIASLSSSEKPLTKSVKSASLGSNEEKDTLKKKESRTKYITTTHNMVNVEDMPQWVREKAKKDGVALQGWDDLPKEEQEKITKLREENEKSVEAQYKEEEEERAQFEAEAAKMEQEAISGTLHEDPSIHVDAAVAAHHKVESGNIDEVDEQTDRFLNDYADEMNKETRSKLLSAPKTDEKNQRINGINVSRESTYPHHPQLKADIAGKATHPAVSKLTSHEHLQHDHYPSVMDTIEQKRKSLFRSQELIDYGSIVVVSMGV